MRLERLRRILVRLLIDSEVAYQATIDTRDGLEGLIIVKIIDDDLIDALRGIQKIEHRRIPEGRDNHTRIQGIQSSLETGVIRQHRLQVLLDFVPLADILL